MSIRNEITKIVTDCLQDTQLAGYYSHDIARAIMEKFYLVEKKSETNFIVYNSGEDWYEIKKEGERRMYFTINGNQVVADLGLEEVDNGR